MAPDLIIFDLDGTLIAHRDPIWKTLHQHFGSDPVRRRDLVQRGLAGLLSYAEWFAGDLEMLREVGATRDSIVALLSELAPTRGAQELVSTLRAAGSTVAVVSGGIGLALDVVLPDCEFDAVFINRMSFDPRGQLIGGEATEYDLSGKATALEVLAERFEVDRQQVAFVGDGRNDYAIMERAGLGIAWGPHAPARLVELADHHALSGDLTDLLPLLLAE